MKFDNRGREMIADYAEILRLYRKFRARPDEPLWVTFVMIGQKLERMKPEPKPRGAGLAPGEFWTRGLHGDAGTKSA